MKALTGGPRSHIIHTVSDKFLSGRAKANAARSVSSKA